jgi:hypothetical protein
MIIKCLIRSCRAKYTENRMQGVFSHAKAGTAVTQKHVCWSPVSLQLRNHFQQWELSQRDQRRRSHHAEARALSGWSPASLQLQKASRLNIIMIFCHFRALNHVIVTSSRFMSYSLYLVVVVLAVIVLHPSL